MNINVANKKCIRHISFQHMKTAKARNTIAILAISLTTILFTALFTITMSILSITEQSNFRQVGGYSHGSFKYLTKEQVEELRDDPLIQEWGARRIVGMPTKEPFHKSHVEVAWCDTNYAKWGFSEPETGSLPHEGTQEAATDTRVLSLLGVEPEIGTEFTITFDVEDKETTETFTLCGFWAYDEVSPASQILIPESRAEEIFTRLGTQGNDGVTGTYTLDVMFKNASHIEADLRAVLAHHGYQSENMTKKDTYIGIGVNWGYTRAQLSDNLDFETALSMAALLLVILFTGYLIIYNVFQISVSNDIRFYGLLKTIGTTGRQIKRLITFQAFFLSAVSIPVGLLSGYFLGVLLVPVIISNLYVEYRSVTANPWIFITSALFSLFTVIISCRKPSKMAAKVSPIEALRYTEGMKAQKQKRKKRQKQSGSSIPRMAWSNLGRSRKKTVVTIFSLSLAIVLLNITIICTNGFDMDKYVSKEIVTDFILGDASFFDSWKHWDGIPLPESAVSLLEEQGGITQGGRTYGYPRDNTSGYTHVTQEFVSETSFRNKYESYYDAESLNILIENEKNTEGLVADGATLYGMEPFCLDKLIVFDGDLSKLYGDGNYIAAVYLADNYGNVIEGTNWAKPGDNITIRYKELEFYNTLTEEIYPDASAIPDAELAYAATRTRAYHDVEYEVAALVVIPVSLSYRISGYDEFVLNADIFKRDSETDPIMYYAFDMEEGASERMENYLSDFTDTVNPQYSYESKFTYIEGFHTFVNTFLLLGGVLSFIVGLVGVLNFLNAFLTSILSRRREFAVLQSVGMTDRQLRQMLIIEGELLAGGSLILSVALSIITAPFTASTLNGMYWFFTYRFTILPLAAVTPFFILLGFLLPLITYRFSADQSIVERLREVE